MSPAGLEHLVNRLADERRGVVANLVHDAGREVLAHPGHRGLDRIARFERVAVWKDEDRQPDRYLVVEAVGHVVRPRPEFHAGHIAHPDQLPQGPDLHHDLLELFRLDQPADAGKCELIRLITPGRRLADLPRGKREVLLADRAYDIGRGQVELRELVRVHPDPDRVVALAEDGHIADAGKTLEFLAKAQDRVIAQVELVVAAVGEAGFGRRREANREEQLGRSLARGDAGRAHHVGKLWQREVHAILNPHLGHVQVGAGFERDRAGVTPVAGTLRAHVQHVLDAVDLLLDRCGHGL